MKYIIIGNGAAGDSAAMSISKLDKQAEILIITEEKVPFYYRPRLIDVVAGEVEINDIIIHSKQFYKEKEISLKLSTKVTDLDIDNKTVKTDNGDKFSFDKLLIAAGAHSFIPPIKGSEKPGVFSLRDNRDVEHIIESMNKIEEIILIGGGLLGLETGNSLLKQGKKVRVIEFFPRLLPRQLDKEGADILQAQLEKMGFEFYLGEQTEQIKGEDSTIKQARTKSGKNIPGEMVVISAGVRSNVQLAKDTPIKVDKAIVADNHLQTNIPDIYAAGDCAIVNGKFYGIYQPAMDQGRIAGENMAGKQSEYSGSTPSHKLKVVGIDLLTAGDPDMEGNLENLSYSDPENFIYKKAFIKNGKITGAMMLGNTDGDREIVDAIKNNEDIEKVSEYFKK